MATCETNGHLFGFNQTCIFCQTPKPVPMARRIDNPKGLPPTCISVLVSNARCAACLGYLDTAWKCNECEYDWKPWIEARRNENDMARDNREG
jgi:hypothetical protein